LVFVSVLLAGYAFFSTVCLIHKTVNQIEITVENFQALSLAMLSLT